MTAGQSLTESSYDEVPYASYPHPNTHPRHLEALAALFGMEPPPLPTCRVLELGCASGGNLIPMAEELPEARFLGIDLSARQITDGQAVIDELGLTNIRLQKADIDEIDGSWGPFDYIICFGVYSWVPPAVQDKILEACWRNLAPNGVAVVSYNTYPGWHFRAAVRDLMRYHAGQFQGARQQIAQAQAVLDFMVEACDENKPYGRLLKEELRLIRAVDESYLYHEHLEDYNQPTYFHEFIESAERHGLQYLSESNVSRMLTIDFPPKVQEALEESPLIRREQYLDFLRNVGFRTTLLCHGDIELDRQTPDELWSRFFVQFSVRPQPGEVDLQNDEPVAFELRERKLTVSLRLTKAAIVCLGRLWPEAISTADLHARALEMLRAAAASDDPACDIDALHYMLKMALAANVLEIYVHAPQCISTISNRPEASRIARRQASRQQPITNRWHRGVNLDLLGRFVLERLDGRHDRAQLEEDLRQALHGGLPLVERADKPLAEPSTTEVAEMVDWALRTCASACLLIA
jgi:methyltransferase-like protein/SAM-dependent methyltransferase